MDYNQFPYILPHQNAPKTDKWPLYAQFRSKLSDIFRNGVISTCGQWYWDFSNILSFFCPSNDIFVSRIYLYPKMGQTSEYWLQCEKTWKYSDMSNRKTLKGPLSLINWPKIGYICFHITDTQILVVKHYFRKWNEFFQWNSQNII